VSASSPPPLRQSESVRSRLPDPTSSALPHSRGKRNGAYRAGMATSSGGSRM
jgi:hypothetical protein